MEIQLKPKTFMIKSFIHQNNLAKHELRKVYLAQGGVQ